VKGISLFFVPKFLINDDGSLGARNDLRCISIEHKMGIHASPTCVMAFGEKEGALGYLLGPPHAGLSFMFIMMNAARISVGVQGLAPHGYNGLKSSRICSIEPRSFLFFPHLP